MTTTQTARYRWNSAPANGRGSRGQFRRENVVGEVKPHNPRGIAAGIDQLVRWTELRPTAWPQLITYRLSPGSRTQLDVLAADRIQLQDAIAGRRAQKRNAKAGKRVGHRPVPAISSWRRVTTVALPPQATRTISLWECPTLFGNEVEQIVRDAYADHVRIPRLPKKSPSRAGADIEHELMEMAEFLRELAAELEAEAEGY